jgi:hypothetical protein
MWCVHENILFWQAVRGTFGSRRRRRIVHSLLSSRVLYSTAQLSIPFAVAVAGCWCWCWGVKEKEKRREECNTEAVGRGKAETHRRSVAIYKGVTWMGQYRSSIRYTHQEFLSQ